MKKIVFFTMLLGLMFVFSGSASAQVQMGVLSGSVSSAEMFKLANGDEVVFGIHTRINDEGANKKGTRYFALNFYRNKGTNRAVSASSIFNGDQRNLADLAKITKSGKIRSGKVTGLSNPIAINMYDNLVFTLYDTKVELAVTRGGKALGKMTFSY